MSTRGHAFVIAGILAGAVAIGGGAYAGLQSGDDTAPGAVPGNTSFAAAGRLDALELSLRKQLQMAPTPTAVQESPPAASAPPVLDDDEGSDDVDYDHEDQGSDDEYEDD